MPDLPPLFADWFSAQGWRLRAHQQAMLDAAARGEDALLIAPTGGGKTLAGFLPSLIEIAAQPGRGLHTLYVSPLKALATDIARNLMAPIEAMGLAVTVETRTGDTPSGRRARQAQNPPDILLTTPESLAVLISSEQAARFFATLRCVVVDEIHALAGTKRGDQLALCVARLHRLAPKMRRTGLSATVAHSQAVQDYLGPGTNLIQTGRGARPAVQLLLPAQKIPWAGRMGLAAAEAVLGRIKQARMTIVFVNTRAQAELMFQNIWRHNSETLPIGLHHGSLDIAQRRRVEAAMSSGALRAVIATSSLDLGIDWGGVDQVLQIGAPKGVSRLLQRIGRANHRLDEPSLALLVPAHRFEVLECEAAIAAVADNTLDGDPPRPGGLDVLAQHLLGLACAGPFHPDDAFAEVTATGPYAALTRRDFDEVLGFVENGGYALAAYERYRKLFRDAQGLLWVANERVARQHRMNIGTIVEAPMLKIRLVGKRGRYGPPLGEVEEYFINSLAPGDTFMFAGRLLKFLRLHEITVEVADGGNGEPKVPAYLGGRMPMTTHLAGRVRAILHDPACWAGFPRDVQDWLSLQQRRSRLPAPDNLLVETFLRAGRWYLVTYCFEGRNAHQTLGMLLTRRMERYGFRPLGFVATDYALAIWSLHEPENMAQIFGQDMLGDDLEEWLAESAMLLRAFRQVAVISGLIARHQPGADKNRRQVTVNSDLIYDVLRKYHPGHILLRATREDVTTGLVDTARLALLLERAQGRIVHMRLPRVSPLAVPVLLEIGRERVAGQAAEDELLHEAESLAAEAMNVEENTAAERHR